jgi:hypothetical protein
MKLDIIFSLIYIKFINGKNQMLMKKLLFLLFTILICELAQSQRLKPEIISSGGGLMSNANVKMSFTIGEPVTGKVFNSSHIFWQGFQQYWKISTSTSIAGLTINNLNCNVYPNPTRDIINILLQTDQAESMVISIVDLNGKVFNQQKIVDKITEKQIDVANYPSGIYLLVITTVSGKHLETFKIQKIN